MYSRRGADLNVEMFRSTAILVRELADDTIMACLGKPIRETQTCFRQISVGDGIEIFMVNMRKTRKIQIDDEIVDEALMRHLEILYGLAAPRVGELPNQQGFLPGAGIGWVQG